MSVRRKNEIRKRTATLASESASDTVDLPLVVSINKSFWIAAGVSSVADLRQLLTLVLFLPQGTHLCVD